jgi:hypothetical protein
VRYVHTFSRESHFSSHGGTVGAFRVNGTGIGALSVICERVHDWADGGSGPPGVHPDWSTSPCGRCRFVRAVLEPSSKGRLRRVLAWSVRQRMPHEAHLDAQCEEPQMQPRRKRRRSSVLVKDGVMIQRQCLRQTIREKRSRASLNW